MPITIVRASWGTETRRIDVCTELRAELTRTSILEFARGYKGPDAIFECIAREQTFTVGAELCLELETKLDPEDIGHDAADDDKVGVEENVALERKAANRDREKPNAKSAMSAKIKKGKKKKSVALAETKDAALTAHKDATPTETKGATPTETKGATPTETKGPKATGSEGAAAEVEIKAVHVFKHHAILGDAGVLRWRGALIVSNGRLRSATYGSGAVHRNVRGSILMRLRVASQALTLAPGQLRASPTMFGDPTPGAAKTLRLEFVTAVHGAAPVVVVLQEKGWEWLSALTVHHCITDADGPIRPERDPAGITLVSAYYVIPNKWSPAGNPSEFYDGVMGTFLKRACNMVLFTDAQSEEKLLRHRADYLDRTLVIVKPRDTWYVARFAAYWQRCLETDALRKNRGLKHSAELFQLWSEKPFFVEQAVALDPFASTWFMWTDIGCIRNPTAAAGATHFPQHDAIERLGLPLDRLTLCRVEDGCSAMYDGSERGDVPFPPAFARNASPELGPYAPEFIQGTFMCGTRVAWVRWIAAMRKELSKFVASGHFAGPDELIIASVYAHSGRELAFLLDFRTANKPRDPNYISWHAFLRAFSYCRPRGLALPDSILL
jgi:hypothetical protein